MTAPPTIVDPRTGEVLSMHDLNVRMVRLLDELEQSSAELTEKLKELGSVTFTYDVTYNATVASSDAKSADKRQADAFGACVDVKWSGNESVARAKARLELQVKALRDAQHNVRSILSGLQSLGANLRTEAGLGGWPT